MDLPRALHFFTAALAAQSSHHPFLISKDGRIFSPQFNHWTTFFSHEEAKKQFQSKKGSRSEAWWISRSSELTSSKRIAQSIVLHETYYNNELVPVQICSLYIKSKDKSVLFEAILSMCPASFLLTWKFNLDVKDKVQKIQLVHCDYFSDRGTTVKIIDELNISQMLKNLVSQVLFSQSSKISQRFCKLDNKELENAFWTIFSCPLKSKKCRFQKTLFYFKEFRSVKEIIRNLEYDEIHNWKSKFQTKRLHLTTRLGFKSTRAPALALFASFQIGKIYGSQQRVQDVLDSLKRQNSSRNLQQTQSSIACKKSQRSSLKYLNKVQAQKSNFRSLALELTKERRMFDFSLENFDIFKKAFQSQMVQKCDLQLKQPKFRVKQQN